MATSELIDFRSDETHLLLNPRMPAEERASLERLVAAAPPLRAHVWIATSGTSGRPKVTALSKEAFLVSAAAVNQHLDAIAGETWACALPHFHVGGLGIHARATLNEAHVIDLQWEPHTFARTCREKRVAFSALVPAQLSDVVREHLVCPRSLRGVIVGGGALSAGLYAAARELGWPVLPSYGMTETCSQVATATLASLTSRRVPPLNVLPHIEAKSIDGQLAFRGRSLLTGYAMFENGEPTFADPKVDGWLVTADRGVVTAEESATTLQPLGRGIDFVKIGGESVDLPRLDAVLERLLASRLGLDAAIFAASDDRLGHAIHLAVAGSAEEAQALAAEFDREVLPFERARAIHMVEEIPRSPLRKLLRAKLAEALTWS